MPFGSEGVEAGIGLAVSGGGFRATLFHIGTLWRLNELGVLARLTRVSSVSGGSITAALLGLRWSQLAFQGGVATNFEPLVVIPLRRFCERAVDASAVGEGALLPWKKISDAVREEYEQHLLGTATLQALPDVPRFVLNATNFATGRGFRFSKPYAGDYRIGLLRNPTFRISLAAAASSAFPPFLSPVMLEPPDPKAFVQSEGADLWHRIEFRRRIALTDGGVYDNLGLETVWNRFDTVLCSDAGAPFQPDPAFDTAWHRQALRALDVATDQSRALRKRALVDDLKRGVRKGAYFGIDTEIQDFGAPGALPVAPAKARALATLRTRLAPFSEPEQCELINFGYALCDAAIRSRAPTLGQEPPPSWPYPKFRLGQEEVR